jgi:lysozyme family protein
MKSDPTAFFRNTILVHESAKHSMDPDDKGNWHGGKLVGSKYGVTGDALAKHRKVKHVTHAEMAALTEKEAIELGLSGYYRVCGIDLLPWDEVMAGVVDLGFNAGPKTAVKVLQRVIGVGDDGDAGEKTRKAYQVWRCKLSAEDAMRQWTAARIAFYKSLNNPKYIKGWTNRANSFLPGTAWWRANA